MRLAIGTLSLTAIALAIAIAISGVAGGSASAPAAANTHATPQASGTSENVSLEEGSVAKVPPRTITLTVKSDDEHAKKGPEGTWHDAFLPASFTVKPGQKVTVVAYNYDEGKHSFTSPMLGLNVTLEEGAANKPAKTVFTFTAPTKAGEYEWFCIFPCDPWSMSHKGYMRGDVTVS